MTIDTLQYQHIFFIEKEVGFLLEIIEHKYPWKSEMRGYL